jgi:hypothetical protein
MNLLTTRRSALRGLLQVGMGVAALPLIASRDALGGGTASQCPGGDSSIGWIPDAMHPVAAGFQDLGIAEGAPGPLRVWYPSAEAHWVARGAKFLQHCTARWPVVLFLHGAEPCEPPVPHDPDYYQRWVDVPAALARSGYVVLVPSHSQNRPTDGSEAPYVSSFIDWARNVWDYAGWLDPRPDALAVAGHSFGGILTARVAKIRNDISAFVSLSGAWGTLGRDNMLDALGSLRKPTFFMWSETANGFWNESLDGLQAWDVLRCQRYGCVFDGGHFDYIRLLGTDCGEKPGDCNLTKTVSADLVALFLSRYLRVTGSTTSIPYDLTLPDIPPLSPQQQSFASGNLTGLRLLEETTNRACRFDLRWKLNPMQGGRHLGA